ncbi:protein phosphatase methylesterase 1 [Tieghemostelium lacteum]|uniref:Protein phosphatase methylesterase 1 n=1 Tax=Tieghemostelium lacteum TaxID=361077 RepID=A0A152A0L3_TIELA|nr:protein phosphatase methylesterase 1 [Tieghemostelium lacteum]|eukprot:KYQ99765.1 protein phosphatase methylesterase 1 [Tieghemostelium lacteum]
MFRSMYKGNLPPIGDSNLLNSHNKNTTEIDDSEYYKVEWNQYFDNSRDITIAGTTNTFRIYESNIDITSGYLFVFLHGGGYTSLSWSLVSQIMKKNEKKRYRIMCYDSRGHGETKTNDNNDLSIGTLINDCSTLVNYYCQEILNNNNNNNNNNSSDEDNSGFKVVLVGHSLGGAVVVKSAPLVQNLMAIIVIDVVEGTALSALSSMRSIIEKRPRSFKEIKDAIKWSVTSATIKNVESARVSIPSQIRYSDKDQKYHWITDLEQTEQYWKDWFTGLSKDFLACKALKLLLLAGTDRLDKELTIAQMQGKFQLIVLAQCGHVIQEDNPISTAETLLEFIHRLK